MVQINEKNTPRDNLREREREREGERERAWSGYDNIIMQLFNVIINV